jgi:hypothetical protein
MPTAANGVTGHPQQRQNGPDDQHNYSDGPDDGDLGDKANDEKYDAENNHVKLPADYWLITRGRFGNRDRQLPAFPFSNMKARPR